MSSCVDFIIVIGLTLLVVSPLWIVLCFFFCFTLMGFIFGSRPVTASCHKYKPALFVFCTTVGKPSQSRSIFQPQPRNIILRHPLQTWQNTDVPEWPIYYSALSVELHIGHFPWIRHALVSHYFSQIPPHPFFFFLWARWDENSSKNLPSIT